MTISVDFKWEGFEVQADCSYERDENNELVAIFHTGEFQDPSSGEWFDLTTDHRTALCQDMIDKAESKAQRFLDDHAYNAGIV